MFSHPLSERHKFRVLESLDRPWANYTKISSLMAELDRSKIHLLSLLADYVLSSKLAISESNESYYEN